MLPYSGDRRGSPPSHAAFSSLSPSATPFTVDGPHPADLTIPSSSLDLPTAPSLYAAGEPGSASWMEPPVSYMAPVAPAASPGYKVSDSAPYGIYSGSHFGNFVDLHPLRSESSNSKSEKHPGTCQESSEALSSGFGLSVYCQRRNAFVSQLLDHIGAEDTGCYDLRQDLNQYPSGSAYDKYMTQLSSCSDKQDPILSMPSANSSEVAKRMVPAMNDTSEERSFSFSPYMNPCRINLDYFDYMCNEQKDFGYKTADKHHGNWSDTLGCMTTGGSQPHFSLGENHRVGECLGNGRPVQQPSEMKYDLRNLNPNVSPSEVGFAQPRYFSSELVEVNNLNVDSPCWKGTPVTYRPTFGNDTSHSVKGTGDYNNSHQIRKLPELSSKYPGLFSKHQEASFSENDPLKMFKLPVRRKNSDDHREIPPINVSVNNDMASYASYLPEEQQARRQKCYDSGEDSKNVIITSQQESSCPLIQATLLCEHTGSHIASIIEESSKKVPVGVAPRVPVERLTSESLLGNMSSEPVEAEESTHFQIHKKGGQEHSHCYPGAEVNMLMSSDSSSRTRATFLKRMHNLSAQLLSTCNGGSPLQEYEKELLQSVIQNLEAASSKRSKVILKADDGLSNSSQIKLENMSCLRNNFWVAMREHSVPENTDSEFKTSISQALTKLPEDKMLDDAEVSQALIYKKLWIEAEALACKLKYELQLARTKLATMKGHNNTQTVPVESPEGGKTSSSTISDSKPQNHAKESIANAATLQCHEGDSGDRKCPVVNRSIVNCIDADVFARLKVLQSRIDNVSSFGEDNCEEQQEASNKLSAVEDAVLARLRVLNSRPDSITSLGLESSKHQLAACTNRADEVDDAVMARLISLKSRPDNITSLGQESSKHQPDACTNRADEVDDAVMARLRILKHRNDNINSLGDVSKKHEEACNDQLNWDEDGVVAKIQVLSEDIGNTTSIAEGCPKPLHSDDLADHSEGQDSVGGLDTIGDAENNVNGSVGTADVATPSDVVNDKSAVQRDDDFVVNHAWPQATGDSHVCIAGSQVTPLISSSVQQYDRFLPEWEHVLKENFFHPGK